ncbi:MAG: hypothetical protein OZSIB_1625 [Candidatus Ozemobacter sibiricus]|uniref:CRISPR system ring nuclease SSO1393-like domain-containing protein n=1 Tax=Candidatus Ozemobacter sibiricus TaxID=2268124 RepID=A0A367ZJM4_9BACT|nr:MAG: hypothetical protein OZSIB_1625 [Candidatus Ozemobacter sibiricus]
MAPAVRRLTGVALRQADPALSAEINGLCGLASADPATDRRDEHFLLASDTWIGRKAGEVLVDWLRQQGISATEIVIPDLVVNDLDDFHAGIDALVKWVATTIPGYRDRQYRVIFHLTGAYKGLMGAMVPLGMLWADEIAYRFENSTVMVRIPRLPLKIDDGELVRSRLALFRRLGWGGEVPASEVNGIPEALLMSLDGCAGLSAWGTLYWQTVKEILYKERIWDSPSPQVILGRRFLEASDGLPPRRRFDLNERIDELARFLESDRAPGRIPSSLRFKPLQGDPVPGCTHEFYAWSDGDARRCFGRFEGSIFRVEVLGKHL